jgi:hypothetical protein
MTELEHDTYIPKAVFRPLSRFLVVLFAAAMSLSLTTTVLAQQSDLKTKQNTMNRPATARSTAAADAIRPFQVTFPKAALDDLRRRIAATRWPEPETVRGLVK